MTICNHCGFGESRGDGFCSDNCKLGWKRRTSDPFTWENYPKDAVENPGMSEETKEKLREYNRKKKEAQQAERDALAADNARAAEELSF